MNENTQERQECTHEPIIDTGVGYYHCPGCNTGWTYAEWEASLQAPKNPSPAAPAYPKLKDQLQEIKEAFQWTFDNMGTPHTSDHFNIPANGIEALNRLIESPSPEVNVEGLLESFLKELPEPVSELLNSFAMEHTYPVKGAIRNALLKALAGYNAALNKGGGK